MEPLLDRLGRGEVVVGDGAWGTRLIEHGLRVGQCPEAFNLERPELLGEIAGAYLDAGAEILTSNTFGASPLKLRSYALQDSTETINRRGVQLLREAAGDRAYVGASVGPTGAILEPYGDTPEEVVRAAFERQIGALAEAGADLILIETMIDLREATLAVAAAGSVAAGLPVLATMTFDETPRGFFTIMGVGVEDAVRGLERAGADIVGSNCGDGSATMVRLAAELRRHGSRPIVIQPNAGLPENRDGRVVYPETPSFMAERARELLAMGVRVIGGCCGTTPAHIRAIRQSVVRHRP